MTSNIHDIIFKIILNNNKKTNKNFTIYTLGKNKVSVHKKLEKKINYFLNKKQYNTILALVEKFSNDYIIFRN